MDQRSDIYATLGHHQRLQVRRWRCICGRRWSRCSPRIEAEKERVALECRARLDRVIAHMRNQPDDQHDYSTEANSGNHRYPNP